MFLLIGGERFVWFESGRVSCPNKKKQQWVCKVEVFVNVLEYSAMSPVRHRFGRLCRYCRLECHASRNDRYGIVVPVCVAGRVPLRQRFRALIR